jgi:hypothetical protein
MLVMYGRKGDDFPILAETFNDTRGKELFEIVDLELI